MTRPDDFDGGTASKRLFGLYPAIVKDIVDPDSLGRIQVSFPWLGEAGRDVTAWARLVTMYADDDQGWEILPSVDTEVIVAFEAGALERPYIVGAVWNGREKLPEAAAAPNNKRLLKTRSGSLLEFDDTDGAAKVTVSMQSGHKLVLDDAQQQVTLHHSNGSEIVINAAGQVKITANSTVEVNASAVNIHAPMTKCDGVVKCETLITQSVISPSYTPGAGNVW
ncbi:phage baseplate assembly protein V [Chitinivorax sp. B]|uniref:phage baseplate assembly protein V n=1 Tax=Chitinivorax sp. B TaxID=2502235 RepID=UPI0010F8075B|nr:phage baseplate assembly protein V [Chitinivorax sp. B]